MLTRLLVLIGLISLTGCTKYKEHHYSNYDHSFLTSCLYGESFEGDRKSQVAAKAELLCPGKMFEWEWEWKGHCPIDRTVGSIHTIYLNCLGDLP